MIEPVIASTRVGKACKGIVDFCEHWFVKQFLYPAVIVLPPATLVAIVQKDDLRKQASAALGQDFTSIPTLLVVLLAPLYMILVKTVYAWIEKKSKPSKAISKQDLMSILSAIEIAVEEKARRMSANAKAALKEDTVCGKHTFKLITQPDQQINLLINGIHRVFEFLSEGKVSFRVGLLKVVDNRPVEWLTFCPFATVPAMSATGLQVENSTVMHCIKSRKTVVVENIEQELKKKKGVKRYTPTSDSSKDKGSQLCYPIVHPATGKIQHVITVAGDKPKCLDESFISFYEWVLNHFVVRISMEQSLLLLKEKTND